MSIILRNRALPRWMGNYARIQYAQFAEPAKASKAKPSDTSKVAQAKGYKKKGDNKDEVVDRDPSFDWVYTWIDKVQQADSMKHELTEDEKEERNRIGRTYNIEQFKLHNSLMKDVSTKIWMQSEAVAGLPEHLRAAALIIDESSPPHDRPWPMWQTPPVEGYVHTFVENPDTEVSTNKTDANDPIVGMVLLWLYNENFLFNLTLIYFTCIVHCIAPIAKVKV